MNGLDRFREHFQPFADRYVIIGGTACLLVMREVGVQFRGTKDIDMVLSIEALDADFAATFWEFIELGGYSSRQRATGERELYRFVKPIDGFPHMLEVFSRKEAGEEVDARNVKKHRNDVFRLYGILEADFRATLPVSIHRDMERFLEEVRGENVDLKQLGLPGVRVDEACESLRRIYLG